MQDAIARANVATSDGSLVSKPILSNPKPLSLRIQPAPQLAGTIVDRCDKSQSGRSDSGFRRRPVIASRWRRVVTQGGNKAGRRASRPVSRRAGRMAMARWSIAAWLPESNTLRNLRYEGLKSPQKVGNRRSLTNGGGGVSDEVRVVRVILAAVTGTAALLGSPMQALGDEAVVPVKE
jgi:hypothetical protein